MMIRKWLQEKWGDRVRQFGVAAAFRQVLRALIRPIIRTDREFVLAIPNGKENHPAPWPDVHELVPQAITQAEEDGAIRSSEAARLNGFLAEGCRGFVAKVGESFAGYALIQPDGMYTFGPGGRFEIPSDMMVLKNLFVLPSFRGRSLGKKLNQTRLAAIPSNRIPTVFVMCENRYAVRNLKLAGFEKMLLVTVRRWFGSWVTQRVHVLCHCPAADKLVDGFRAGRVTAGGKN